MSWRARLVSSLRFVSPALALATATFLIAALGPLDAWAQKPAPPAVKWVWSGAVTTRSAVMKARVTVPGAEVRLVVSAVKEPVAPPVTFRATADADGAASFALDGLDPATGYQYNVELDGATPLTGAFRTFADGPSDFRIAFGSCAKTGSKSTVFDAIRASRPDVFIHMGDFHYENIAQNDAPRFRRTYDKVLASPTQSLLYRSVPIVYVFDDHDFGGNNASGTSASRPAALTVYRQFVPHYPLDDGPASAINQAFSIGRARVIVTDTRSQRTPPRGDMKTRTMLGARQLQWLKDQLSSAVGAPLVIWVNPDPWIASPNGGSDDWGAYALEREDIANHIDRLGLTHRLVMLSGDAHMVAIDDGSHSNYATGAGRDQPGFVVMHAAPFDRWTSSKGGPYSHGISRKRGQFGLMQVADNGTTLRIDLSGRNKVGGLIPGQRLVLACAEMKCAVEREGSEPTPTGR